MGSFTARMNDAIAGKVLTWFVGCWQEGEEGEEEEPGATRKSSKEKEGEAG